MNSGRKTSEYRFPVLVEHDDDGYFAVCPDLQGCYTQGDTYEEALSNIEDAIRVHIESRLKNGEEIPAQKTYMFSTVDVAVPVAA